MTTHPTTWVPLRPADVDVVSIADALTNWNVPDLPRFDNPTDYDDAVLAAAEALSHARSLAP